MITIFILLGLGFLCGGVAAIVDGLPYMVLERGFTQVIIGTVLAAAGVVMLALSWVLVELRRLKKSLSNAAMAMSVASMVGSPGPEAAAPVPPLPPEPQDGAAAMRTGLAAAGAGALAGAGTVLAATHFPAAAASDKPEDKAAGPDPFGARLAEVFNSEADLERDTLDETRLADVDALPVFDPFRPVDPQGEPEPEPEVEVPAEAVPEAAPPPVVAIEPAIEPEAEPETDASERLHAGPAVALPDEPPEALVGLHAPSDIEDPLTPEAAPAAEPEADEFGMLRESLAGLGLRPEPGGGRIEPSFSDVYRLREHGDEQESGRPDDLAAAATWMEPALQRRAPWFETAPPAASEPVAPSSPAEPATAPEIPPRMSWPKLDIADLAAPEPVVELPPWPPHAREAAPFEPVSPSPLEQGRGDAEGEGMASEDASSPASEDEATRGSEVEPVAAEAVAAEDDAAADGAPAASDEGVVGAYQVGEAHFTIYADGSIQARTPDGDYSFASMDELKVYLASEKSRLGV
ncbi:MAG TPA: hypothetical protein VIU82_24935 [Bosea sp. (in: a-proteobacteria)]